MKFFSLTVLAALSVACVSMADGGSSTVGPANPASVLCVKSGGASILFVDKDTRGELGVCVFGERGAVEEWTFFRYKSGQMNSAVKAFLANDGKFEPISGNPMPHPAGAYCEQIAGGKKIVIVNKLTGDESGLCQFADGSMMEEWTLWRGFKDELNVDLLSAIKK